MFRLCRFTGREEKFSLGLNPSRYELEEFQTVCAVPPVRRGFQPFRRRFRPRRDRTTQASPRYLGRQSVQVMRRLIALLLLLGAVHLGAEPLRITTWNLSSSVAPEADSAAEANRLAG